MEAEREILERTPPQAVDVEQAVLGAFLLDNTAVGKCLELTDNFEDCFYRESHRKIFGACVTLYDRNEPVDLITLSEELSRRGQLEEVGGNSYLVTLTELVATAANVEYHAEILLEKAIRRQLIEASTEIIKPCYDDSQEVDELLDRSELRIFSIKERHLKGGFTSLKDILPQTMQSLDEYAEKGGTLTGLPTGFDELDDLTAGLQPADLIVVAGRPAMGKTAFCLNVAEHLAVNEKIPVAVFSLEMSKEQLAQRMLCSRAKVSSNRLRRGKLKDYQWTNLSIAVGPLSEAPIYVDDSPAISALELKAKARRLKSQRGVGLVIVDYMQLMQGPRNVENRQQEIAFISRSLKNLAKELSLPVMALSQLSRQSEARGGYMKPQLADLRECVTGDTLVVMSDGRRLPVKRLVGSTPEVMAVSREGRIVLARSDMVWHVGRRPVFVVRLASGRTVRATAEHRLLGAHGWRRVGELRAGDRIAIARAIPEPVNCEEWSDDRVALLGHLIGDGSYLSGQPLRYTTSDDENSTLVAKAAEREFSSVVRHYPGKGNWHQLLISGNGNRWHPRGVNLWLRQLGIFGQRSHEKRIPEDAFRLPNRQIALLLRHLWATDGTIHTRKEGSVGGHAIHFSTNSESLAGDVAALLLRLGIVARIRLAQKRGYLPAHLVTISGSRAQLKFIEAVGASGPRAPQALRLREALAGVAANTNVDTLPIEVFDRVRQLMKERGITQRRMAAMRKTAYGGSSHFRFAPSREVALEYGEILGDEALSNQATSDLFWDTIAAVEPAGEEEVYDLTVPGISSWLADGIVSHNSGAIEQDADVVMFIYRPFKYGEELAEKYRREVLKTNIPMDSYAEVLIGKQRNGPTGSVPLAFVPEYTRFERLDTIHAEAPQIEGVEEESGTPF
jgi:replicative DNA helicase